MRRIGTTVSLLTAVLLFYSGLALANGTIRVTFKYKDESGAEQPLTYAYLYLRDSTNPPPVEKYYKNADYIFGPSDYLGRISASVPEGTYFVRLTRRKVLQGATRPLGPPEAGDYTWIDYKQITVTTGSVIDLGTKYAFFFGEPLIKITGVIKDRYSGAPLAGRYVRAQTEPCIEADYSSENPNEWVDSNNCGPVKYLALQKTDAQGRYTLLMNVPGTYYIVESRTLGDHSQQYAGNRSSTGWSMGPVTVNVGDDIVLSDMEVPPPY